MVLKKITAVEDGSIVCLKFWNGARKLLRMGKKKQEILMLSIEKENLRVFDISKNTLFYKYLLGKRVGDFVSNKSPHIELSFKNAKVEAIYLLE